MSVKITDGTGTSEVDVTNSAAKIYVGDDSLLNGILAVTGRADDGQITGVNYDVDPEADDDFRWRVSFDSKEFEEPWSGSALNTSVWSSNVTTFATAVAAGQLQLNSANSAAANGVARVTSYRTFPITKSFHTQIDFPLVVAATSVGIPNTTWELGLAIASGTTEATDGIFLRMNASGELRLVAVFNGSVTQSTPITYAGVLLVNISYKLTLVIASDHVTLWLNDKFMAELNLPAALSSFTQSQSLPLHMRTYNSASVPASATMIRVGPVVVSYGGLGNPEIQQVATSLSEAGGYQGFSGGTIGQTINWTNSTEPVAATLSNTAAGYTTLGGQWSFAAPAGAVTDFALFGYQVPAVAASSHNRNLLIHGISIDAMNVGAAVATTATILQWAIAVGSTAVSLATGEAATTKAPRRIALGMQGFQVAAGIGAQANRIYVPFAVPLLAEAGTFVQVIVRVPVGTATASQVIRGTVQIDARWKLWSLSLRARSAGRWSTGPARSATSVISTG